MIRRNFQVYRCKSGIAIFEWRVNKKYAYSPFSGPNKYKKHHLRFQQNFYLVLNFGNFLNPTLLLWFLLFNWVFLWNYFFKNEDNSSLQLKGTNLFMKNIEYWRVRTCLWKILNVLPWAIPLKENLRKKGLGLRRAGESGSGSEKSVGGPLQYRVSQ